MKVLRDEDAIRHIQRRLKEAGFYDGPIDALWGGVADGGLDRLLLLAGVKAEETQPAQSHLHPEPGRLSWGGKVSPLFRARVMWIAEELRPDDVSAEELASDLMACMAWETGRTFSPSVVNKAGSGATGLIQFMPSTAVSLGTTTAKLARMSAEDQLNYVFKYFEPWKGRLRNLGDVYMAILWPLGVGKPDSFVLWEKGKRPTTYRQNAGLDANKDGKITRAECLGKITAMRAEGFLPKNAGPGARP